MAKGKRKPKWHSEALRYLQAYQEKHVQALCSLPELYANVVAKYGVSIGVFHDGIRALAQDGQIRPHPFSGALSALERGEYALIMGKEIIYYVEVIV